MRDVVTGFYVDVLTKLIRAGAITTSDSVLVVCGGPTDKNVMEMVGFTNATITNIDGHMSTQREDAENLSYENGSFDLVIVHAGLHHCYSPHRALLEMYRVSRKCALAFESRDSLLMRVAVHLGLTQEYESDSLVDGRGGVADSGIPNFIYRWTEREVRKTISSFDPSRPGVFRFFYDFRFPIQRFSYSGRKVLRGLALVAEPFSRIFARLLPSQCNEFAFAVLKEAPQPK